MLKPKIVYIKPIKLNIVYAVATKTTIEQVFSPVICRSLEERGSMDRMMVFCKRYTEASSIYLKDACILILLSPKELLT